MLVHENIHIFSEDKNNGKHIKCPCLFPAQELRFQTSNDVRGPRLVIKRVKLVDFGHSLLKENVGDPPTSHVCPCEDFEQTITGVGTLLQHANNSVVGWWKVGEFHKVKSISNVIYIYI